MTPAEYEEILGRLADILRWLVTERSDLLDRLDRIEALLSRADQPAAEPDDGLKRLQANAAAL